MAHKTATSTCHWKMTQVLLLVVGILTLCNRTPLVVKAQEEAAAAANNDVADPPPPPAVDYTCTTCGDCEIKNVGNCCGYEPKCVNKNFEPDVEGLQQWCQDTGTASVCGYSEIDVCSCSETGICKGHQSSLGGVEECSGGGRGPSVVGGTAGGIIMIFGAAAAAILAF